MEDIGFSCLNFLYDIYNYFTSWRHTPEEIERRNISQEIDRLLARDRDILRREVKLLLLGTAESGKSTFLKQMRIIHRINFEVELIEEFQHIIYQNIVKGMQVLVDAREKLMIPWEHPETSQHAAREIAEFPSREINHEQFSQQYSTVINTLWQDRAIKKAFHRRSEYQLSDSVSYFLDELERISKLDYIPTHRDILYCRRATKGIHEFRIHIDNIPFLFVDVGGQRTQRQKWTKCFDSSVTSIIFFVSTSEFDQVLMEDRRTNRIEESKNIFDTIVNNSAFEDVSIIIFFNKIDLLVMKVKDSKIDISLFYSEFTGNPHSVNDVQIFILEIFLQVAKNSRKTSPIYHHFTTAIDTQNIRVVFNSVKDTILQRNLEALNLL